ncbi:type IV pilus biogenesis/stability protein PilW [Halomonas sp. ZH2S]|uniref:Type IV pilus biogenesis/stability protein PilW n=1 Tax=Vreelandella zhuhanensis TaxID=2684210 RepID=A0A7X3GYJ1_9GAMM|nr:type IV pilus biogenesis/stability protein PilW [Halomonas zhuhanensis]MWJ27260.1 type IV pilus biogenesis/stability protein PilW [Halomonas zhuhanensis]
MHRRYNAERCKRTPLLFTLLSALWLSGCAAQATPSPGANNNAVEAYTQLGVAYLERDNLSRALNALDRALQLAPTHSEALQAIALVYQRQGESALADEYFQQALRADPNFTRARNNYAAFLYDQARFKQACEQLEKASQDAQYANRTQLFTNLGQCYLALGETEAARTSLQRAQQIDPRNPRSYLMLAELEYSQGHYQRARQPLETFLRLAGPNQMALSMAIDIAHAEGEHAQAADYQRQLDALR